MENSAYAAEMNPDARTSSFAYVSSEGSEQLLNIRPLDVRSNGIVEDSSKRLAVFAAQFHSVMIRHQESPSKFLRSFGLPLAS